MNPSNLVQKDLQSINIGIIGTGAVGSILAKNLARCGHRITACIDKCRSTAKKLAAQLHLSHCVFSIEAIESKTELIIIAVPDSQIASVDGEIAQISSRLKSAICVHTSGAFSGSDLKKIARTGTSVGSLHPLQTFPSVDADFSMEGIYFAIEGSAAVVELLDKLVVQLKGIPVHILEGQKAVYHAAAVFASNFIPVLLRSALELLGKAGISPDEGRKMLSPLLRFSVENCIQFGETQALTGPVARGDKPTIQKHLKAIHQFDPELENLYRYLSLKALQISSEKGLEKDKVKSIQSLLSKKY